MFKTTAISRRQIALLLVYTGDLKVRLERNKSSTKRLVRQKLNKNRRWKWGLYLAYFWSIICAHVKNMAGFLHAKLRKLINSYFLHNEQSNLPFLSNRHVAWRVAYLIISRAGHPPKPPDVARSKKWPLRVSVGVKKKTFVLFFFSF